MREEIAYAVIAKRFEAPQVATLTLVNPQGELPPYRAGQYIIVYLPELGTSEGKAYSISSAPSESTLTITVHAIGRFSNYLISMEPGDIVTASLPYGFFYVESTDRPLIMAAAGIGISPFRSMIVETFKNQPTRNVILFHSSRTVTDAVFKEELDELARVNPCFTYIHYVTREETVIECSITGRISAGKIIEVAGAQPQAEYMICGPQSFTEDLWREFRSFDIPEHVLHTETLWV